MKITGEKMDTQQVSQFDHEIEINRVACPLHVLQMKKGMDEIKSGERLKIKSTAYVAPELLAAARQIGNDVEISSQNEIFLIKR